MSTKTNLRALGREINRYTLAQLGEKVGRHAMTVHYALRQLEKAGEITIDRGSQRRPWYTWLHSDSSDQTGN